MLPSLFEATEKMEQRVRENVQEVLKEAESATSEVSKDVKALRDVMVKNVVTGASAAFVPGALEIFQQVCTQCVNLDGACEV